MSYLYYDIELVIFYSFILNTIFNYVIKNNVGTNKT